MNRNRKPVSLKRSLLIATAQSAGIVLAFGCAFTLAPSTNPTTADIANRPSAPSLADRLVDLHDCWTGEAPADVEVPGHVVVSVDDRARYAGPQFVALALEQIFEGQDHGLTVHAFCR